MIEAVTAINVSAGVEKIQYKASLPWMVSQVLVYSGVKTDYADFCAISGWSAEFHYDFAKKWITYLTFEGLPSGRCFSRGVGFYGKRFEAFSWPETETEEERLLAAQGAWDFILGKIAEGTPVLTDYIDGGVLYGYDETLDDPAIYFSTNGPGFGAIRLSEFQEAFRKSLHGLATLVDAEDEPATDARKLLVGTLANLILRAYERETDGCAAGIAGMQSLVVDLLDPARDWGQDDEWLCWPLSEQTEIRLCTAAYLRRNADVLGPVARLHLLTAADHYEQAFGLWRKRWEASALTGGEEDGRPDAERMGDTGRREAIAGYVCQALGAELLAVAEISRALATLKEGGATP